MENQTKQQAKPTGTRILRNHGCEAHDAAAETIVPTPAFAKIGLIVPVWNELSDRNDRFYDSYFDDAYLDESQIDDECYADSYGLPIQPFTEDDLRFLRDFILSSAMYVEQLESMICDTSDDFWEAREHAYRIITALLIRHYEYELEG